KHYPSFSLVFLAVSVTLLAHQATARVGGIHDLCRNTDYQQLCREVIRGANKPSRATENAILSLITETNKATVLASKFGQNQYIDACKGLYSDAIDSLKTSLDSLKTKDKGTLNSNLSAALTYYGTCDDTYAEAGQNSPLAATNKHLAQMADNSLALASLIQ
ncbi:PMEI domain-containing protein, partial [Cephalotus follicularis]